MTYPNGRVLSYNYASGLDDAVGRLSSLTDSAATTLESYSYLGMDIVVKRSHPQSGVDLSYIKASTEGTGDAGDQYTGMDRFNRVVNQKWVNASGTVVDRYTYTYDRDGNVTAKANPLNTALSETYSYDGLNRLTASTRNGSAYQSWGLDASGNMSGVTDSSGTVGRTHNRQNQLTASGLSTMSYDANGNLTHDDRNNNLHYDAWNRLVGSVSDILHQPFTQNAYDGLGRRIQDRTTDVYFDAAWQEVEDRSSSGSTTQQFVWSPVYVNALVERDRDTDANGSLDERVYATQDANWNVTGLITTAGAVAERFSYDAYGNQTVLSASGASTSDAYGFLHGFQGGKQDAVTGLILFQHRDYSPTLQRWVEQDYAGGYVDGLNLYQMVRDNPLDLVDPHGTDGMGGVGGMGGGGRAPSGAEVGSYPGGGSFTSINGPLPTGDKPYRLDGAMAQGASKPGATTRPSSSSGSSSCTCSKTTAYIWPPHQYVDEHGNTVPEIGHATLDINGVIISYWPQGKGLDAISSPHIPDQTLQDIIQREGYGDYYKLDISGLDQQKIFDWWNQYANSSDSSMYNLAWRNCAQVSSRGLKAGGANINTALTPMDLLRELQKLKESGVLELVSPPHPPRIRVVR